MISKYSLSLPPGQGAADRRPCQHETQVRARDEEQTLRLPHNGADQRGHRDQQDQAVGAGQGAGPAGQADDGAGATSQILSGKEDIRDRSSHCGAGS